MMEKIIKVHEKIKFEAFGKVLIQQDRKQVNRVKEGQEKDENETEEIYEEQLKVVEKEVKEIENTKNGRAGRIWEVRRKVFGGGEKKD